MRATIAPKNEQQPKLLWGLNAFYWGSPGVLGIRGVGLIFKELGSTDNFLRELGSKLTFFGGFREPSQRVKKNLKKHLNGKASISFDV